MLWGYVRANPGPFVISVIGAAIYAGAAVGTTIALGRITDQVILPSFEPGGCRRAPCCGPARCC